MNTAALLVRMLEHGAITVRDVIASGIPDGQATAPGDLGPRINEIIGVAKWVAIAICVLAFIAGAAMWAFSDRHGHGGGVDKLVKPCVAVALIAGSAGIVGFFV
ncbi:MAG: hypothetical protein ACK5OX_07640 [Desertimonas sp.]